MQIKTGMGEIGNARMAAGATLTQHAEVAERLSGAGFVYDFRLLSPDDSQRARYVGLCDRIASLERGIVIPQARAFEILDLRDEVRAIPLHEVWRDQIHNLFPTVGKNDVLDKWLAASTYTAAWYMGLTDTGSTYAAGDTMSSHAGWTENTGYSNANRITCAFNAASAGSKALTAALAFNINATSTLIGAFITTVNTKGGTTGILGSVSSFTGGNRAVTSGDTLSVSGSWAV